MGEILVEFEDGWYKEGGANYRNKMLNLILDRAVGFILSDHYFQFEAEVFQEYPQISEAHLDPGLLDDTLSIIYTSTRVQASSWGLTGQIPF